ncbi:MAG TPA: HNH endonuclease signature motif containing protein [Terriglobales bacterium]|nr:HNH endonuclease signature motif containing protein [Terriglobales bacterium]
MKRKRWSEKDVIETLAYQGVCVPCYRCGKMFVEAFYATSSDTYELIWWTIPEREHIVEIALGGDDAPSNCRYSCKGCHAKITNGSKATSAGSSKHRIAKTRRLAAGGKKSRHPMKSSGRKIPSRPFPKKKAAPISESGQYSPE